MKKIIFIFLIIMLCGCADILLLPHQKAQRRLAKSKEAYMECLKANPNDPDNCENLKRRYEIDLTAASSYNPSGASIEN